MIKWQATPPIQAKALKLIKKLKKLYFFLTFEFLIFFRNIQKKKLHMYQIILSLVQ